MGLHIMFTLWQHGFLVFVYCSSMKCFLNSEFKLIFFWYQRWRIFFQSFHDLLFAFCNRKTYTWEMRLRMQIMIYQNIIFSDIFFFLIYCRNTILMRYDTTRIKTSNKIGKIIIWYMREFCEYNCIISFCI